MAIGTDQINRWLSRLPSIFLQLAGRLAQKKLIISVGMQKN